jgi:PAS domain S-box-containing protein
MSNRVSAARGRSKPYQIETSAYLSAIVESSKNAIIGEDSTGTITLWNGAATQLLGYTAKEMIGEPSSILVPPTLLKNQTEILEQLKKGILVEDYQSKRLRKDGHEVEVLLTTVSVKDDIGQVIGIATTMRDICLRQYSDEARFRLAAIVESSDDAIIAKDLNGIITSWNAAAERLFGYTADEIVGHSVLKLIPRELHYQEPLFLEKLKSGERIEHFETQRITKTGKLLDASLTISPVKDEKGQVIGASKIMRDISQRKALERSLLEAEKIAATGRMAATVAHEINNPLESVVNLLYLARTSKSVDKKVKAYLELAESEIERVSHIARQTLGYYRDTTSAKELCFHDIVEDVLTVYHSKMRSMEITLEREFHEVSPISLREGEVNQIISNLVVNAIEAMPTGGLLRVTVAESSRNSKEGILLSIHDTGVGIEQEHLPKLFDPFFTTRKNVGNGLGLWVVKQFVDGMGGTITVESRTVAREKGTTFGIFIPYENKYVITQAKSETQQHARN